MKIAIMLIVVMVVMTLIGAYISNGAFKDTRPPKPKDAVIHTDPDDELAYYSKNLDVRYGRVDEFRN